MCKKMVSKNSIGGAILRYKMYISRDVARLTVEIRRLKVNT